MVLSIACALVALQLSLVAATQPLYYTAAVYDHAIDFNIHGVSNRSAALGVMMKNIDVLEEQMSKAKMENADIFVFPEYGLYGHLDGRESASNYAENIPEPSGRPPFCPSLNNSIRAGQEVLFNLSLLARTNRMYLAVNMADKQPCPPENMNCPSDGQVQYNTEVVFDRDGCLIAKYHKRNLFESEKLMWDVPPAEHSYFDTEFGRFGLMVCFDAVFKEPAITLVEDYFVTNVIFSTAWMNVYPHYLSVAYHSGWARNLQVNFLASNIHNAKNRLVGSGIYSPEGVVNYIFNATKESGTLVIGQVPTIHSSEAYEKNSDLRIVVRPSPSRLFNAEIFGDNFTFKALEGWSGNVSVYQGDVHCNLDFTRTSTAEEYALGAFDGMHTLEGEYYLEICLLVRCSHNYTNCDSMATSETTTKFSFYALTGSMPTQYAFPEVVTPDANFTTDWTFTQEGKRKKITGEDKIISSAVLMGRNFKKDPTKHEISMTSGATSGMALRSGAQHLVSIICISIARMLAT